MFFKRPGVLKTKDMMKIFDKFTVEDQVKNLLEQNHQNADDFQRIELLCKQALSRVSSKAEKIEVNCSGVREHNPGKADNILKSFEFNDEENNLLTIINSATQYQSAEVIVAPKNCKGDINKLYNMAKKEKRRLKDIQKKIYNILKKWELLHKKASVLVNKINSKGPYEKSQHSGDSPYTDKFFPEDKKKLEKYTEQYNGLCMDMLELKPKIAKLFEDAGCPKDDIKKAMGKIAYPKLDGLK